MTILDFFVPMPKPVAKARPRFTRTGVAYTPKETADAERYVAMMARRAIRASAMAPCFPVAEDAVGMGIYVILQRPKGCKKKYPTGRPDWDNYAKLVCDALNGVAYKDDSQIVQMQGWKRYAEQFSQWDTPGYYVWVHDMEGA